MDQNTAYTTVTWNEIKYHMTTTMFCCSLSSTQQTQFGNICNIIFNDFIDKDNTNNNFKTTRIPVSSIDVDRFYLKRSTSIAQNVPIPTIIELDDHACISITEVIHHFLYFAIPIDGMLMNCTASDYKNILPMSSLMTTTRISNHLRKEVKNSLNDSDLSPLIIPIILWSDDFEPNHVKQHKKST